MRGPPENPAIEWGPVAPPEGVRIGRHGSDRWVEWAGIGRLRVPDSGAGAQFWPDPAADAMALQKFRATSLLTCQRYLLGKLSLHGSAVRLSRGAVVLVGEAHAGKTTTAMALVEQAGGDFLADDHVPIDWQAGVAMVPPVEDHFWLTDESAAWFGLEGSSVRKLPHAPRSRAAGPEPLRAIVQLMFDESLSGPVWEPLHGQEKFLMLSNAQICYSTFEEADTLRNLRLRAELSAEVPAFRLRRPRTLAGLVAAAQAVALALGDAR
jgi:hypothetical protein